MLLAAAVMFGQETPPLPQRFLEETWRRAPPLVLAAFVLAAVVLLIRAPLLYRQWQRSRRLEREGEVLFGQVAACTLVRASSVDAESGRASHGWHVDLHYEFTTRCGRLIRDEMRFTRGEMAAEQAPTAGTPVAILCTSDGLYQIL
jgi:hypothetical protein